MLVADDDLQFLTTYTVRLRPESVVLGHDLAVLDDSLQLVHHGGVDEGLLPDHGVVLVVAVVGVPEKYYLMNLSDGFILLTCLIGIPELAIRTKLKLEKLVTKFSLVSNIVTEVKIIRHVSGLGQRSETNICKH